MVVRRSYIVLQVNAVFEVVRKVALRLQLVNPVEPVIAPTFANFELTLIHSEHHLGRSQVIYQLNPVLVHLWLHRLNTFRSLIHLEEDRNICTLGVLPVSIWVNF